MKKFFILASCDPYNARFHYNGQKVTRHDGATPVEWVLDDNFGEGYTIEEARKALMALANDGQSCDWAYYDAESVNDERDALREDLGEEFDESMLDWYAGPGVYDLGSKQPVLLEGEHSFRDDTMTYSIEEL